MSAAEHRAFRRYWTGAVDVDCGCVLRAAVVPAVWIRRALKGATHGQCAARRAGHDAVGNRVVGNARAFERRRTVPAERLKALRSTLGTAPLNTAMPPPAN